MTYFSTELKAIIVFVIASLALSIILFLIVYIITFTSKVDFEKSSAYECGFAPFSETNYPFEVQFALIAIMFLLFDIEVLYLYPVVTSVNDLMFSDFIWFLGFFGILGVGVVYEMSRKVIGMTNVIGNETSTKCLGVSVLWVQNNPYLSTIGLIVFCYILFIMINKLINYIKSLYHSPNVENDTLIVSEKRPIKDSKEKNRSSKYWIIFSIINFVLLEIFIIPYFT